jgi:hypothetical protein
VSWLIVPQVFPAHRWRWGISAMVGAFAASWATRSHYSGKAGMVVLLVLLVLLVLT